MGRLVLIIMVLFSITAIYSEAHAAGKPGHSPQSMLQQTAETPARLSKL